MINFLTNYYDYIIGVILLLYFIINDKPSLFIKGLTFVLVIDLLFTMINYIFYIENSYILSIEWLIIIYSLFCKLISNVKSNKINKNNVCIIFYRPKKLKQFILSFLGINVASSGLLIGKKLYQMRYEEKTLQERDYTNKYVYDRYLIIDTGFKIKDLKGDWRTELLKQKARQLKTLYTRFNCLRSLRFVLNQTKFKYNGELLPSIFLLKYKLKGYI